MEQKIGDASAARGPIDSGWAHVEGAGGVGRQAHGGSDRRGPLHYSAFFVNSAFHPSSSFTSKKYRRRLKSYKCSKNQMLDRFTGDL